jgi:hypothetical protein
VHAHAIIPYCGRDELTDERKKKTKKKKHERNETHTRRIDDGFRVREKLMKTCGYVKPFLTILKNDNGPHGETLMSCRVSSVCVCHHHLGPNDDALRRSLLSRSLFFFFADFIFILINSPPPPLIS